MAAKQTPNIVPSKSLASAQNPDEVRKIKEIAAIFRRVSRASPFWLDRFIKKHQYEELRTSTTG
jgi:hypothetical protein